jgi:serine/threonine protein kinase
VSQAAGRSPREPPREGEFIGDFEILRLLGEGSFAQVFLARQVSLGRLVALKVSAHQGSEARTLAHLEHDHIVRIFAESVDPARQLRLLCMQYVPGPTLDRVIRQLKGRPPRTWSGRAFLEVLDAQCTQAAPFDPAAARDRELLAGCDFAECVCWLGSRLAEALAHAHGQGVLHRDIKPANILLSPYGRPLLADFNIAFAPEAVRGPHRTHFGGTLAYMAPEHLEAFTGEAAELARVDERSDIYGLGVVLYELATGGLPFLPVPAGADIREGARVMAAERRARIPAGLQRPGDHDGLARVIGRCLEPQPEDRYQTAAELVRALEGSAELRRVARELPPGGWIVRSAERRPFLWLAILALLPHCLGSIVNISYNGLRIGLTEAQWQAFARITLAYNVLIYPLCLLWLWRLVAPVVRGWSRLTRRGGLRGPPLTELRRRVLRLPGGAAVVSVVGWLPGALLFPLALDYCAGPVGSTVYGHFLISFAIAGLIALTYSVFGVHFVVLRILYPRLWDDGQELRQRAGPELASLGARLWALQGLAVLIPLAAAMLLVGTGPEQLPGTSYRDFRWLVIGLIGLGTAGFVLAVTVSGFLSRTLVALTGGKRTPADVATALSGDPTSRR